MKTSLKKIHSGNEKTENFWWVGRILLFSSKATFIIKLFNNVKLGYYSHTLFIIILDISEHLSQIMSFIGFL